MLASKVIQEKLFTHSSSSNSTYTVVKEDLYMYMQVVIFRLTQAFYLTLKFEFSTHKHNCLKHIVKLLLPKYNGCSSVILFVSILIASFWVIVFIESKTLKPPDLKKKHAKLKL